MNLTRNASIFGPAARTGRAVLRAALGALCFAVLPLGCGDSSGKSGPITAVAPADPGDTRASAPMTTKERLRVQDLVPAGGGSPHGEAHGGADPHAGIDMPAKADGARQFTYTLPAGWQEGPASAMRAVNLKISDATECYVSVLGGSGGGLASNLNRWRKQMGQPDLSDDEIAALPKRPLLGGEASFIQVDGAFTGMGAAEAKPDYRMLGLALVTDTRAVFIKMTGPKAEVEAQAAGFDTFCASLAENAPAEAAAPAETPASAEAPAPQAAAPAPPAPPAAAPAAMPAPAIPATTAASSVPAPKFDASKLQWSAPPSWQRGPDRMMRVVTYTVGNAECYITVLDGPAGGIEANLNRWRGQMGQPGYTADEVAALPKLPVMGKEALYMEAKGTFTAMNGQVLEGQMMLGAIAMLDNGLLTVKMTGPEADVLAEIESFKAFCSSIAMN